MLKDLINYVAHSYLSARELEDGPALGLVIRKQAPLELEAHLQVIDHQFAFKGSHGVGNWSAVPWFAVFEPNITTSAMRGYYVVYLFSADMRRIYLSMNQGATKVKEEFGRQALDILKLRAGLMKARVPEFKRRFSADLINLASSDDLPRGYEAGHAFGKSYDLPLTLSEATLAQDLVDIVKLYLEIINRGGLMLPSETVDEVDQDEAANDWTVSERPRYRQHRKLERSSGVSKKVKQTHGTVCQGCSLEFAKKYGPVGEGYIEAHHLTPISELPKELKTDLNIKEHFAVLCANCHRIMHRKNGPKTIQELKAIIRM
jgi:5-methylcytosine-specific restriction enzyme A